jgi:hypothetical protein
MVAAGRLESVGSTPVRPGLTVVPGTDATLNPPGAALVVSARGVVEARRAQRALDDLTARAEQRAALRRSARRMRARAASAPGADAAWSAAAADAEALRPAAGEGVASADLVRRLRHSTAVMRAARGGPLVVLGDDPDLRDCLDDLLDAHPQVVLVPGAGEPPAP